MKKSIKHIMVDKHFFDNLFEVKRKKLQKQLGLMNLSQSDFTKMITGLKIKQPKISPNIKTKGRKRNDFFNI